MLSPSTSPSTTGHLGGVPWPLVGGPMAPMVELGLASPRVDGPSPLERAARGEPGATKACIVAYGPLVWSIARRLSRTQADAEEAVQEVFVDLWKNAARFDRSVASDTVFVAMIARRRVIDRIRARGRRPEARSCAVEEVSELLADPSADRAEVCAEAALAHRALGKLRPEQRQVLLLWTQQGLSHEEISTELSMPLGTVKAHARRGLLRVRELLLDGESAGEGGGGGAAAKEPS